ncbi:MAG: ABC-F family ATP-binding cassette domain-containing protein, partial [Candidatus Hydrothermae bacterium]|nr:ABC-F family ATP-binding cassette domain-containing protein [Candidatus Hydrothermae bacterium]
MITLKEVHKSFGAVDVLRGVDWTIPRGARVGLIGLNGSGKSTLLLIIKGDLEPDSGEVLRPPGLKIGYLPQEPDLTASDSSVLEESLKGREDLLLMERRIRQLEDEMKEARGEKLDALIEEHSRLHQEFLKSGGYALKSEALKVLKGLGFSHELMEKKVSELSGGFRARLELAKILLAGPDVLLLDEPTNNLDIPSLVWLESYLKAFRGTCIVVSHDRYFLDSVVESVAEIERGKLYVYSGNYSSYVSAKRQREEAIRAQWKEYEREKEKLQRFIERYRAYKDKANLVRDRKRKLERLKPPPELPPQRDFRIKV